MLWVEGIRAETHRIKNMCGNWGQYPRKLIRGAPEETNLASILALDVHPPDY